MNTESPEAYNRTTLEELNRFCKILQNQNTKAYVGFKSIQEAL